MREVSGKGTEDEGIMKRASKVREGDMVVFLRPIEVIVTRGSVRGVAESLKHVKGSHLGEGVEDGIPLSVSSVSEFVSYAEFSEI
jgi:hypothetical protein